MVGCSFGGLEKLHMSTNISLTVLNHHLRQNLSLQPFRLRHKPPFPVNGEVKQTTRSDREQGSELR